MCLADFWGHPDMLFGVYILCDFQNFLMSSAMCNAPRVTFQVLTHSLELRASPPSPFAGWSAPSVRNQVILTYLGSGPLVTRFQVTTSCSNPDIPISTADVATHTVVGHIQAPKLFNADFRDAIAYIPRRGFLFFARNQRRRDEHVNTNHCWRGSDPRII